MNILIKNQFFSDSFNNFILSHEKELDNIVKLIGNDFYPEAKNVLRFAKLDLNNVKVIILGMDPYPSHYMKNNKEIPVATGRSFEVGNVDSWEQKFKQASLTNILKALYFIKFNKEEKIDKIKKDIKDGIFNILTPHEWFDKMENEGVIFLNATLTVKKGKPNSHTDIWKNFINDLINYINDFDKNNKITWLLWGKNAKERIYEAAPSNIPKIICKVHPASRVNNDFVTNSGFNEIKNVKWI